MIAELAIGAGLVAAATFAYRALKPKSAETPPKKKSPVTEDAPPSKPALSGPRGLRVGDVLLYADTELWLAGCFELDEEGFVARVFRAPGNRQAQWVLQLDDEAKDIALVNPTEEIPDGAVPSELPIGGMRLSLRRRGSVVVHNSGSDLPPAADKAEVVILGGPGGRVALILDFQGAGRLALEGTRMAREMFDVLPGGDALDED